MSDRASSEAPWMARQFARVRSHPVVATLVVLVSLLAGLLALPGQIEQAWQAVTRIGPIERAIAGRREAAQLREREKLLCPALASSERAPRCPVDAEWISLGAAGEAAVVPDWRIRDDPTIYLFGFRDGQLLYGSDLGFQAPGSKVWARIIAGVPWFIVHNLEGSCGALGFDIFTISKLGSLKKARVADPAYGPLPADLGLVDYGRTEPVLIGCGRQLQNINGEWIVVAPDRMYRLRLADSAVTAETLDPAEEIYAGSDTAVFVIDDDGRVTLDGTVQNRIIRVRGVEHTLVVSGKRKFVIRQPDGRLRISPVDGSTSEGYSDNNFVLRFAPGRWFLWFDTPAGHTRRVLLEVKPGAGQQG